MKPSQSTNGEAIAPFLASVPEIALEDLRQRLARTRWPEREPVCDWSQGVPLSALTPLIEYWQSNYDWRRCEAMLNGFGQYRTRIDGLGIHFLHVRSVERNALPLLITHGWPGSVLEFHKIIGPLTDPVRYGASAGDAFHLVLPSLPGYGFSDKPAQTGWDALRTAKAWAELMRRLGYGRYVAQGGDWGSFVTTAMARLAPAGLCAIHLNLVLASLAPIEGEELTPAECAAAADLQRYGRHGMGYGSIQSTRPQTLGFALADSPVGQAAWIFEKFREWSDCAGDPWKIFSRDELLDNITLYWLSNSAASSARFYWETWYHDTWGNLDLSPVDLPTAATTFPKEIARPSRRQAERTYRNIIYWNEMQQGGHFAALEQPAIFVRELRDAFRQVRA
ncbi:MAG TPA: epoxide hydrolase [Rhizomicrobium sp.]|nr:epoxide hydrolase [Rhizomicrobium sp.]